MEEEDLHTDYDAPEKPGKFWAQVVALSYIKYRQFFRDRMNIFCGIIIPGSLYI